MLKTESVTFTYDGLSKFNFPDIQLNNGNNLLVLGDSGVGKTTFILKLLGRIVETNIRSSSFRKY